MSDKQYNPVACEHKLPNGFTAWSFQSEEKSNLGGQNKVSIHVCLLCGEINIGGYRPSRDGNHVNVFHETFNIYHPDAIDAIIKQANFYNEQAKWGRLHPSESAAPPMRPEDHEQVEINMADGLPEYEASFQSGYSAGHDAGYEKGKREGGAVWVKGEYDRMYEQVKRGIRTVCYVDYKWSKDDSTPCRDICTIRADHMELSARGIGYGYPRSRFHKEFDEKESFIEMCKNSNVEWLDVSLSPAQSGKEEPEKAFWRKLFYKLNELGYTDFTEDDFETLQDLVCPDFTLNGKGKENAVELLNWIKESDLIRTEHGAWEKWDNGKALYRPFALDNDELHDIFKQKNK